MSRTRAEDQMLDHMNEQRDNFLKQIKTLNDRIDQQRASLGFMMDHLDHHCPTGVGCLWIAEQSGK